ncbi:hypothetical protein EV385_6657 [Krasilnikovia cinnamomea]|uniref:Uncharacterized protein n=1 Tax=Krasilnikovia cinnamomea TaxID=349313 RepID=A0A4Q7Z7U0_9ACTN|nr:hypothetical protein [Krasilnikovia cinnamomea]RZU46582.1 hypothetical protein EV385_6657 [Krasilnikovia cinnamomea]
MTTFDSRKAALADLREWAQNQAQARQRLIAAAWRAGVRNVAELSRTAGVSRDTVYEDLRRESIDPTKRSAMPTITALSRRAQIRDHLTRIIAAAPLRASRDDRADLAVYDHQVQQLEILWLLFGRDEVTEVYSSWLTDELAEQAKTATGLTSWSDVAMSTSPIPRWNRDRHGFLCVGCSEAFWRIVSLSGSLDRWCKRCARDLEGLEPSQVWDPRLPTIHGSLEFPGLMPDEPRDNMLHLQADASRHDLVLGEANAFLLSEGWMGLTADESRQLSGPIEAPVLDTSGTAAPAGGPEFMWTATFTYDATPQGWHKNAYGFRLTSGTLSSTAGVQRFDDAFRMLDTIALSAGKRGQR